MSNPRQSPEKTEPANDAEPGKLRDLGVSDAEQVKGGKGIKEIAIAHKIDKPSNSL